VKTAAVALLAPKPETGTWFRVTSTRYLPAAISMARTAVVLSRFYDPYSASPQFATLYLSDSPLVAQFEAQVLLGSPNRPGGPVTAPRFAWTVLQVQVSLTKVVDLSDLSAHAVLDTTVQELTGDWWGYRQRSRMTNVRAPIGTAPTQTLGEEIHRDPRDLEGFLAVSARVPTNRNLIVFPDHLGANSFVQYEWEDQNGRLRRYRVDQNNPNGTE